MNTFSFMALSVHLIVFAVFAADILGMNPVDEFSFGVEQLDGADTVSAVPKAIVTLGSVR